MSDRAGPPFATWEAALAGPKSAFFGIGADGRGRRAESHYRAVDRHVSFDISNNQILCSLSAQGLLENACILTGLVPSPGMAGTLPGVLAEKQLLGGGPWPFAVQREGETPAELHHLPRVTADLLGDLFPVFSYRHGALRLRMLAFAPMADAPALTAPRAIVVLLHLENEGAQPVRGTLGAPVRVPDLDRLAADCHEAVICLDDTAWQPAWPEVGFQLEAGQSARVCFAVIIGEGAEEVRHTGRRLRQQRALDWLNQTWQYHAGRLGRLSIPDDPYYAEAFVRFEELCRQSVLRMGNGRFGAGFWGSDFIGVSAWASPKIWNKDNFHAMLPMAMLEPRLCADAISFFLRWGVPHAPFGRAVQRFPHAARVTHSLTNALSGVVLAGAYYQLTGDREFFRARPEILEEVEPLLHEVLWSRLGAPFLFPSGWLSDGQSRGDYHTGSNLVAWYALHQFARIAGEAYNAPELAAQWAEAATKVKQALLEHCIGASSFGPRFLEGANADGTWVTCHDGEETDTTLMPWYGFCEPDDPAVLNHCRLGLSPENPYYAPEVGGIWWGDVELTAATFPGWMTALAGARTEGEVQERLDHIRRLTDVDGSIWWWPYKYDEADPARPRRRDPYFEIEVHGERQGVGPGKCGWAAGIWLCLFVHNVLGLAVDVPARHLSLRPFCPWPRFSWDECRLGSSRFDFAYERVDGLITGRIANRNEESFAGTVELVLPEGAHAAAVRVNGTATEDAARTERYHRSAVRVCRPIPPGETLAVQLACDFA